MISFLLISFVLPTANQDNTSPISGSFSFVCIWQVLLPGDNKRQPAVWQTEPVVFDLRREAGTLI
jgi:hypothetical protein